jgi:hypothetical protein
MQCDLCHQLLHIHDHRYIDDNLYHTQRFWYSEHRRGRTNTKYFMPQPFDKEFHIILNIAVGGTGSSYTGFQEPDRARIEAVSQVLEVDWVRVYDMTDVEIDTPVECGDHSCDYGEPERCPADCVYNAPAPKCGDHICHGGEQFATCPQDCPA